ncbi:DNA helicase [Pseudodesulfovibrio nedwellii]|uniref:DNA helicase n=1 Tax=Pseudodesulfovibrio nedwellii TaxID=2973072 RepID=A0ABN6S4B6_9BACT|nr:nuclease-related domain-containing DEAD/DEAH box helicase [Pseudodesulfovibrio nedwellii]BDQ36826.1 DNA helicase [Pseudodesulfovibrio nedwellii]
MSNILPDDVDFFQTEGEERFYNFLKHVAKPEGRFLSWYLPDLKGREPDFIMFSKDVGLIIFEIKDWALNQIIEANPQYFVLNIAGKPEKRKNPLFQAKEYFSYLIEKLTDDGRLLSREPEHYGKPRIPISYGAVFPNINKFEFLEKGLGDVIPADKTLFWDDMHSSSDICTDPSGRKFSEMLKQMFPPVFLFQPTGKDCEILRNVIFPVIRMKLPNRTAENDYETDKTRLQQLDYNQEAISRKMDEGHRIVTGPSGSGKTLILVHRAAQLLKYNPKVKRILFVCYNLTLANYIRRLLADKKLPLGKSGIDVFPFYQLCSRIVHETVDNDGEGKDYYELILQEAMERCQECDLQYDAILIDEGQDFSDDMLKVVMGLLSPTSKSLTIAMDKGQRIYQRRMSWKEIGIDASGRTHHLDWVYRNTEEIAGWAARFMGEAVNQNHNSTQHELLPNLLGHHGPAPSMPLCGDFNETSSTIIQKVKEWLGKGYPASEIAVLYTTSKPTTIPDLHIPTHIKDALEENGILCQWISEDARSKEAYDVTTDKVSISTIHSVKGLDYACVLLVGVDFIDLDRIGKEQARNLIYVAMTRARTELVIPWVQETKLTSRLQKALQI